MIDRDPSLRREPIRLPDGEPQATELPRNFVVLEDGNPIGRQFLGKGAMFEIKYLLEPSEDEMEERYSQIELTAEVTSGNEVKATLFPSGIMTFGERGLAGKIDIDVRQLPPVIEIGKRFKVVDPYATVTSIFARY